MKTHIIFYLLILLLVGGCRKTIEADVEGEKGKGDNMADFYTQSQEAMRFMMEAYGFDEEDLAQYNLVKLMSDYQLRMMDYSADEIREILKDQGDMYLNDGIQEVFSLLDAEEGKLLNREDNVSRIGYYYNSGTFVRRMVFDMTNGLLYVDNAEPFSLSAKEYQLLTDILKSETVYSWKSHYEGEEEPSTGNFRWKIVFELEDGSWCAYGGYTQDMTHLPEGFLEISDTLLSISNSPNE